MSAKMTRDEIVAMPAGREMDALIELAFFDDFKADIIYIPGTLKLRPWWRDGYRCGGDKEDEVNTFFSEDVSASRLIAEKLGLAIIPQSDGDGFRWLALDLEKVLYAGSSITLLEKNGSAVSAETIPLAICRAALLAVMGEAE